MNVLLEWALASSLLTLAVLGIRALLKEKISLRARYALWLLLAVRLFGPDTAALCPAGGARHLVHLVGGCGFPGAAHVL